MSSASSDGADPSVIFRLEADFPLGFASKLLVALASRTFGVVDRLVWHLGRLCFKGLFSNEVSSLFPRFGRVASDPFIDSFCFRFLSSFVLALLWMDARFAFKAGEAVAFAFWGVWDSLLLMGVAVRFGSSLVCLVPLAFKGVPLFEANSGFFKFKLVEMMILWEEKPKMELHARKRTKPNT